MFFSRRHQPQSGSRIGAGCQFEGHLQAEGLLQVDGTIRGPVTVNGDIEVSETGCIEGTEVRGQNILVTGVIKANIFAEGQLTVGGTARVDGDIVAGMLEVDPGAYCVGHLTTYDSRTPFYGEQSGSSSGVDQGPRHLPAASTPAPATQRSETSSTLSEVQIPTDEIEKVIVRQG